MEFLRAGEALLRSSQPLLPFLAPSAYRAPYRTKFAPRLSHCRPPVQTCRSFTTSQPTRQQGSAAAAREEDDALPQSSTSIGDEFSAILDSALDGPKGVPTAPTGRTSRFQSPRAQQANRTSAYPSISSESMSGGSSTDEILEILRQPSQAQRPSTRSTRDSTSMADISFMLDPQGHTHPKSPPNVPVVRESPIKLNGTVGRTVYVDERRGIDVGRAFRQLEIQCARNNVRRDMMRQRFHERPGLKRKRLKSERWRRRFKEQFRGTVQMVQRLKSQGW